MIALSDCPYPAEPGMVLDLLGWNMETYYFDATKLCVVEVIERPVIRVHYQKVDEENPIWRLPENTRIDVSEDQQILLANGASLSASQLRCGDRLQHFCGNGHEAEVMSVEPIGSAKVVYATAGPHAWIVTRGIVLGTGRV